MVSRFSADLISDANYNNTLTDNGGLDDFGIITTEPEVDSGSSNNIYVSFFNRTEEFEPGDQVIFTMPNTSWSASSCATSTIDADADGTIDGSFDFASSTQPIYTFSGTTTNATVVGLEFCMDITSDTTPGNELLTITTVSTESQTGSVFIYNIDDNDVTVTADVQDALYFKLRDSSDTTDTNACNLGTLDPGSVSTCSYRLAVETSAANGFALYIIDGSVNQGLTNANLDNIDPVTEDTTVAAGQESYGIALTSATGTTKYDVFTDDDSPIPTEKTMMLGASGPYDYQLGTTTTTSLVTHRAAVDANTAEGSYTQTVSYYVTANY